MGRKNVLRLKAIKKIHRFAKLLKKEKIPISQFILFGSYSSGQPKKYSDIDLCIISPSFGKDSIKERVKLSLLADKIDWRIEPHPYNPEDFSVEEDPFASEIRKTGIIINL